MHRRALLLGNLYTKYMVIKLSKGLGIIFQFAPVIQCMYIQSVYIKNVSKEKLRVDYHLSIEDCKCTFCLSGGLQ